MAGYYFYSMSNNALDAYRRGEMPMSKWTKKAILQRLEEQFAIKEEHLAFFRSLSLSCLREKLLVECGWHHTSKFYNATEFYDVDYNEDEDYYEAYESTGGTGVFIGDNGSGNTLTGNIPVISLYVDDANYSWTDSQEDSRTFAHTVRYLDIACQFLMDEASKWGQELNLIYDFY